MTKQEQIADYLRKFPNEKPKELAERMNREIRGLNINGGQISNVKSLIKYGQFKPNGAKPPIEQPLSTQPSPGLPPTPEISAGLAAADKIVPTPGKVVDIVRTVQNAKTKLGQDELKRLLKLSVELGEAELNELADVV